MREAVQRARKRTEEANSAKEVVRVAREAREANQEAAERARQVLFTIFAFHLKSLHLKLQAKIRELELENIAARARQAKEVRVICISDRLSH